MTPSRLLEVARDRMREDAGAFYDDREPPQLEMLDDTHFVAHRYVYNFAQSGSDWADHYILLGHIVGDTIELEPFYVHLTENESDDYDKRELLDLLRQGKRNAARARFSMATLQQFRDARRRTCSRCGGKDTVVEMDGWPAKTRCDACGAEAYL